MRRESAWKRVQILWDPVLHGMLEWYWYRENVWTRWYIKGLWKWRRKICSEFCVHVWGLWSVWHVNFTDRLYLKTPLKFFFLFLWLVIFVRASGQSRGGRKTSFVFPQPYPPLPRSINWLAIATQDKIEGLWTAACPFPVRLSPRPSQTSDFGDVSGTNVFSPGTTLPKFDWLRQNIETKELPKTAVWLICC